LYEITLEESRGNSALCPLSYHVEGYMFCKGISTLISKAASFYLEE